MIRGAGDISVVSLHHRHRSPSLLITSTFCICLFLYCCWVRCVDILEVFFSLFQLSLKYQSFVVQPYLTECLQQGSNQEKAVILLRVTGHFSWLQIAIMFSSNNSSARPTSEFHCYSDVDPKLQQSQAKLTNSPKSADLKLSSANRLICFLLRIYRHISCDILPALTYSSCFILPLFMLCVKGRALPLQSHTTKQNLAMTVRLRLEQKKKSLFKRWKIE